MTSDLEFDVRILINTSVNHYDMAIVIYWKKHLASEFMENLVVNSLNYLQGHEKMCKNL